MSISTFFERQVRESGHTQKGLSVLILLSGALVLVLALGLTFQGRAWLYHGAWWFTAAYLLLLGATIRVRSFALRLSCLAASLSAALWLIHLLFRMAA